jgi:hypothetical protein
VADEDGGEPDSTGSPPTEAVPVRGVQGGCRQALSPDYLKGDHRFNQDKLLLRLPALAKKAGIRTGHK